MNHVPIESRLSKLIKMLENPWRAPQTLILERNRRGVLLHHGRTIPVASTRRSAHWVHVRPSTAASEQNHLYSSAAQRARVAIPKDPLPWRVPERGSRVKNQPVGSQSASKGLTLSIFLRVFCGGPSDKKMYFIRNMRTYNK